MPKLRTAATASTSSRKPYGKSTRKPTAPATMVEPTSRKQPAAPQKSTLELLREEAANNITTPIYFWKPHQPFGFLGQWYITPTRMHDPSTDQTYGCTEQYMMYHKARTFKDDASADAVMATDDPKAQKALGRKVVGFTDSAWDSVKLGIVFDANMLKFAQGVARRDDEFVYPPSLPINGSPVETGEDGAKDVSLKELLLATGSRELVEASPRDKVWGVGFGAQKAEELRGTKGGRERWGTNYLGKALMEVREKIREQEDKL